jgi:CRP/FNR family transcriptional regulator, anaerobic regulatory protein
MQSTRSATESPRKSVDLSRRGAAQSDLRPSFRAVPFGNGPAVLRLSSSDREHLASIATMMRVTTGTILCRRGEEAKAIYSIGSGTMAAYRERPDGGRRVMGFLFAEDIFGLAHRGIYVNNVKAVTPATVFRFPTESLTALLTRDAGLQFRFLCKATQVLRETQRQAIMLTRRDPVERVAMFLAQLEDAQAEKRHPQDPIELPMTRQDIADYVNLPVGSIAGALDALEQRGLIERHPDGSVAVTDRRGFESIVSG